MARIKQVMLALRVTRKTAHAMIGTQRFKLFLTSGEQLMRINLMADVKDKLVRRTVKRPVQRDCQLYVAQIGRQMASPLRNRIDNRLPQFGSQFIQLLGVQTLYILRPTDAGQNRHRPHLPFSFSCFSFVSAFYSQKAPSPCRRRARYSRSARSRWIYPPL